MTTTVQLDCRPLTPHLGAEVLGVDLAHLDEETFAAVRQAFWDHSVLVFRDQHMDLEEQMAFGSRFGPLHVHPASPAVEGHREVMLIHADEKSTKVAGNGWHTDVSCDERPPLATILRMEQVPPAGGDTLFASMYRAYEGLSDTMRAILDPMWAVHASEHVYRGRYGSDESQSRDGTFPSALHPVVRTIPESGRRALFVNPSFTTKIKGLAPDESEAILRVLYARQQMPEYQARVHWEPHTVTMWDNRCVQHYAIWDYFPHVRHGYRVSVVGERPAH